MEGIKDNTVIITGGSRGIGRACCLAFARAGANIVFTYSKSAKEAELLQKEIEGSRAGCLGIQADVRDYDSCRQVVVKAMERFSRLDILVNNAGITRDKSLLMMSLEDWREVIDTDLNGVFNMSRAAVTTLLKQKKGCIINMSSVSGLAGIPRQSNYCAAKAGIIGFTKSLAKEVSAYNIRVNAVCPGYIETEMVSSLNAEIRKSILGSIPAKRLGRPEEVAELCLWLASDKAAYISGEAIRIDGALAA